MATVDLTKAADLIFSHGSKAVLLVWVFMLQIQVAEIREDYKDCMNNRVLDSHRTNYADLISDAVLPKQIKIKRK